MYYYNATPSIYYYNHSQTIYYYNQSNIPYTVNSWKYTATSIYNDTYLVNTGLGVVIPSNKLTVNGTFNVTGGVDTTIGLLVNSTGGVSIGTSSASAKLHIVGGGTASDMVLNSNSNIKFRGDGVVLWGANADYGTLSWDTGKAMVYGLSGKDLSLGSNNVADQLYIKSGGNVGIGTSTPAEKLTVAGNITTINSGNVSATYFFGNGSKLTDIPFYNQTASPFFYNMTASPYFYNQTLSIYYYNQTQGTSNIFNQNLNTSDSIVFANITSTGNLTIQGNATFLDRVGIGITTTTANTLLGVGTDDTTIKYALIDGLRISGDDNAINGNTLYSTGGNIGVTTTSGYIIALSSVSNWAKGLAVNTSTGNVGIGTITPSNKLTVNGTFNVTGGYDKVVGLIVNSSGGVGIGTDRPSSRFEVVGTANFTGGSATNLGLLVDSSGKVGIGISNPSGTLELAAGGDIRADKIGGVGGAGSTFDIAGVQADPSPQQHLTITKGNVSIGRNAHADLNKLNVIGSFNVTGITETDLGLFINNSGGVGIGTNNPSSRFEVVGTANFTGGSATNLGLLVDSSGKVGIGTSTPHSNLEVIGATGGYTNSVAANLSIGNSSAKSVIESSTSMLGSITWSNLDFRLGKDSITSPGGIGLFRVWSNSTLISTLGTSLPVLQVSALNVLIQGRGAGTYLWVNGSGTGAYNKFGSGNAGHTVAGQIENSADVYISDDLEVDGYAYLDGGYADVAEILHTVNTHSKEAERCSGDVACLKEATTDNLDYADLVCINPKVSRTVQKCDQPNSRLVAGVVSNTTRIFMGESNGYPIAVAGLVFTHVTNENGNIIPGDLLVSSSKPGFAMKNDDPKIGTVAGKAYDFCDKDECTILMFVALS